MARVGQTLQLISLVGLLIVLVAAVVSCARRHGEGASARAQIEYTILAALALIVVILPGAIGLGVGFKIAAFVLSMCSLFLAIYRKTRAAILRSDPPPSNARDAARRG